jgi:hypothetical protein
VTVAPTAANKIRLSISKRVISVGMTLVVEKVSSENCERTKQKRKSGYVISSNSSSLTVELPSTDRFKFEFKFVVDDAMCKT